MTDVTSKESMMVPMVRTAVSVGTDLCRLTPPQAVASLRRRMFLNTGEALRMMPAGKTGGGEVVLFRIPFPKGDHFLTWEDIDKAYSNLRLTPAHPYTLIALNAGDNACADAHPNITHWVDADGKKRYIACAKLDGIRDLSVGTCDVHVFQDFWYFVGVEA